MKIDVLIPTYNRSVALIKNLEILKEIIAHVAGADVGIIISDNASTDDTVESVDRYIRSHPKLPIKIYHNDKNNGLTTNVISCVSYSTADYIMLLGDDDFINFNYLQNAINALNTDTGINCILPSFEAISEDGERLGFGRDLNMQKKLFSPGIQNIIDNSVRAHQISGIILKRKGLYDALLTRNITNLYPQIYMVAYSCLNGKCLHLPEWPVLVTQTNNKVWRYDDVGLLIDIFQNISRLGIADSEQYTVERTFLKVQSWRFLKYWKHPIKELYVIYKISSSKNTSRKGYFLHPFYMTYVWLKNIREAIFIKVRRIL